MYAAAGDWDAACLVAGSSGGEAARRRVWLRQAQQLLNAHGPDAAVKLLVKVRQRLAQVAVARGAERLIRAGLLCSDLPLLLSSAW